MKRQKIRLATLLAIAATGLAILSADPAGAAAKPATPAVSAPLLAMITANESFESPDSPTCDDTETAIGVDATGHLVDASYSSLHEQDCSIQQGGAEQLASGWGDVTQVFAEPFSRTNSTATVFAINTNGEMTAYGLTHGPSGLTLSTGTVIGSGWNGFKHVTYAGDGVFFAVATDGNLLWYRDLDVAGRTADWADGGIGHVIGTGWQNFPLVFAGAGAIYASTDNGDLLWYGYWDWESDSGAWSPGSGSVVGTGWDTVAAATADHGEVDGHILIHTVDKNGNVHFYDHFDAYTGSPEWSSNSGVVVLNGWAG